MDTRSCARYADGAVLTRAQAARRARVGATTFGRSSICRAISGTCSRSTLVRLILYQSTLTARSARDVDSDQSTALAHLAVQARPGRLPPASRSRSPGRKARIEAQRDRCRWRQRERIGTAQAAQGEEGARIRPALGRPAQACALRVVFRKARGSTELAFLVLDVYSVQRSMISSGGLRVPRGRTVAWASAAG